MPSIGETLREARMRQRLDIADVELRTKIRAKYLRALENEEFGLLPGPTFVKTFLRTYAEVLGLDPHRLVEEYRVQHESRDEAEVQPIGTPAASRRERDRRRPGRGPGPGILLAGAVVAVLAFFAILGLVGGEDDPAKRTETPRTETTTRKKAAKPKPKPKRKPAAPRSVALRISPDAPTYVCLDRGAGTERLFEGTVSEPQTWRGKKLRLNLGRTGPELRVNGKRFPVEPVSNPVGYEFSPGGSKELPEGQRPCA